MVVDGQVSLGIICVVDGAWAEVADISWSAAASAPVVVIARGGLVVLGRGRIGRSRGKR